VDPLRRFALGSGSDPQYDGKVFDGEGADWFPVIDGYNLPNDPPVTLANGEFAKVPTIVGANADEARIFFVLAGDAFAIETEADFEAWADGIFPGQGALG
jgi:para-nitrobenzyl esterase